MRHFDWLAFCQEHHIPFIERGKNVKRGELAIHCPACGSADPSMHMGLSLETGWWSCWRNRAQHSGKSPIRLIMLLLRVPYPVARKMAGLDDSYIDPEGFDAMAAILLGRSPADIKPDAKDRRFLTLDDDFMGVDPGKARTRRHWEYLRHNRGFDDPESLCADYGIFAGVTGSWSGRVILPYIQDGVLVSWTGRAIAPATIKYKDLSIDDSLLPPKHTLFNHDAMLDGGKALVLVEGPFDALKLDCYGKHEHVRAVALSTNSIKAEQAYLLQTAVDRFDQIIVMMDSKTPLGLVDSWRMKSELSFLPSVAIAKVPFGAGDGGALTPEQVTSWSASL